jgi:hypothetical protein
LFVLITPQAVPAILPCIPFDAKDPPMRHSLRDTVFMLLGLSLLVNSGCTFLNPNNKLNVNRGDYHDEWEAGGVERRASTEGMDHEDADGLDKWLYSPKYRAINRNLGVD